MYIVYYIGKERYKRMTVKELVENGKGRIAKADFIEIVNKDFRGCKPMDKYSFVSFYEGRDVWNEEVADFSIDNFTGGVFTLLSIKL